LPAFNGPRFLLPPSLSLAKQRAPLLTPRPPPQRSRWSGDPPGPSPDSSKSAHPSAVDFGPSSSPPLLFPGKDFSDSVNRFQYPIPSSPLGNTSVEDEEVRCCSEARASTVCSCVIGEM
ncbi:hypothetical protein PVAP13_8NG250002, partial [Panicum virgatum]